MPRKKGEKSKTPRQIRDETGFMMNFNDTPERRALLLSAAKSVGVDVRFDVEAVTFGGYPLPKNISSLHAVDADADIDMGAFWNEVRRIEDVARRELLQNDA
jgi:hypothetical protein